MAMYIYLLMVVVVVDQKEVDVDFEQAKEDLVNLLSLMTKVQRKVTKDNEELWGYVI